MKKRTVADRPPHSAAPRSRHVASPENRDRPAGRTGAAVVAAPRQAEADAAAADAVPGLAPDARPTGQSFGLAGADPVAVPTAVPAAVQNGAPVPWTERELTFDDVPFRGIVEQALAGIYVVQDERFVYANDTFAAMFGYSRDEFIGRRMVDCVTEDSADEVMVNYWRRIRGEVDSIRYRTKGVRKDGALVHLELHASALVCRGQPAVVGVALDVTENVRYEQELEAAQERLQQLARHLNTSREIERARLAREVHDVLGGMLTTVKFDLIRIVRRSAAAGQEQQIHQISSELVDLVQQTIDAARVISEEMRPQTLDLLGLAVALRQLLHRFGERHGHAVEMTGDAETVPVPPDVAMQVYRIAQEALTNIVRHAEASRVEMAWRCNDSGFTLLIDDNGRGIAAERRRPGSIGLFSMAERAREIGAELTVAPGANGGTRVALTFPRRAGG